MEEGHAPEVRAGGGFTFCLLSTDVELDCWTSGRFAVRGPQRVLSVLRRVSTTPDHDKMGRPSHGQLSPLTALSLPAGARAKAGIPPEATHYCFAYPLDCLRSDYDTLINSIIGSVSATDPRDEAVLLFFLLGGFCYFAHDEPPAPQSTTISRATDDHRCVRATSSNPPRPPSALDRTSAASPPPPPRVARAPPLCRAVRCPARLPIGARPVWFAASGWRSRRRALRTAPRGRGCCE